MNKNELKLKEITVSLGVLNRKEKLSEDEEELVTHLKKERELLLKYTDSTWM